MKWQPMEWEKVFVNHVWWVVNIPKYKELKHIYNSIAKKYQDMGRGSELTFSLDVVNGQQVKLAIIQNKK